MEELKSESNMNKNESNPVLRNLQLNSVNAYSSLIQTISPNEINENMNKYLTCELDIPNV